MRPFLIVEITLILFIVLLGITPVANYDIWSLIKTGEYILNQRDIPRTDVFSYTADGQPWVCYQWLSSIISYLCYYALGLNGLIGLKIILLLTVFGLLYILMRRRRIDLYLSAGIVILTVLVSRIRFQVRHELISYVFCLVFLILLDMFKEGNKKSLIFLPFLTLIWVNLHPGVGYGLAVLCLFLSGQVLSEFINKVRNIKRSRHESGYSIISGNLTFWLWLTILISFAVVGLNPFGFNLVTDTLSVGRSRFYTAIIGELRAPDLAVFPFYTAMLFLTAVNMIIAWRRLDITDVLYFGFFSHLSLRMARHVMIFAIMAAPILARYLELNLRKFGGTLNSGLKKERTWPIFLQRGLSSQLFVSIMIMLILIPQIWANRDYPFGLGTGKNIPVAACDFIENSDLKDNVFNSDAFGGYFIWRFYPRRKVFIDGRLSVYSEDFWRLNRRIGRAEQGWERIVRQLGINYFLLEYQHQGAVYKDSKGIWTSLHENEDWVLVWWDDVSLIYVRNIPEHRTLIDKYGYRYIDPNRSNLIELKQQGLIKEAIRELKLAVSRVPESAHVHNLLAAAYLLDGQEQESLKEVERVLKLDPFSDSAYINLGLILMQQGKMIEAMENYRTAIRLAPDSPEGYSKLATAYMLQSHFDKAEELCQKALAKDRRFIEAYYNLGLIYIHTGRFQEAGSVWQKALEITPADGRIRQMLKSLEEDGRISKSKI